MEEKRYNYVFKSCPTEQLKRIAHYCFTSVSMCRTYSLIVAHAALSITVEGGSSRLKKHSLTCKLILVQKKIQCDRDLCMCIGRFSVKNTNILFHWPLSNLKCVKSPKRHVTHLCVRQFFTFCKVQRGSKMYDF